MEKKIPSIALQLEKIRANLPTIEMHLEPLIDGKPVKMQGYLDFKESQDGWEDSVRLVDEGPPGQMGFMPFVMDDLKQFHGKEVLITVELVSKEKVDA